MTSELRREKDEPRELRLSLLENGLDFVREGIERLYGEVVMPEDPRAYKYALMHIFSGTLLILKERVRREHVSLIYKDLKGGQTIDFATTIERLEHIANFKLDPDAKKLLDKVQKKRNELEHYEAQLYIGEVDKWVGQLVQFLDHFLETELKASLLEHISSHASHRVTELAGIAERLKREWREEWNSRASKYRGRRMTKAKLQELADEYHYDPSDPDSVPADFGACPTCGEGTVVPLERDIGICTTWACRELHVISSCERCGEWTMHITSFGWCQGCVGYMQDVMDRD